MDNIYIDQRLDGINRLLPTQIAALKWMTKNVFVTAGGYLKVYWLLVII